MNIHTFSFLAISIMITASCSQKMPFPYLTKEFDITEDISITDGVRLDVGVLGADDIYIWDSLLIITTNDINGMLKIFNKNTLKPLAAIASKGRAHNEFLSLTNSSWQAYIKDGELLIPFQDLGILKEINITQSLLKHKTIIDSSIECSYDGDYRSVAINNDIYRRFEYKGVLPDRVIRDKVTRPLYSVRDYKKENEKKIKVLDAKVKSIEPMDQYSYFKSNLYIHPHKNIIIQPFSILNYIVFFDLDNKKTFAIHRAGTISFNETLPQLNNVETSFSSCVCTDEFFLILYFADRDKYRELSRGPELLVFDWDGNLMANTILNNFCLNIAFDKQTNRLYGVDPFNEFLYTFDISNLLKL